jgi:hypothetical protein
VGSEGYIRRSRRRNPEETQSRLPTCNTIFEDTQVAVLYQDRAEAGEYALAEPVKVAAVFEESKIRRALYRPYVEQRVFFDTVLNQRTFQWPHITGQVLCASGKPFMVLCSDLIADLHLVGAGAGTQCFPLSHLKDAAVTKFRRHCGDDAITKEDIFHYIYALLHHPEYRERYAANLEEARKLRTPQMSAALALDLNTGLRDKELREIRWEQIDLVHKKTLTVGKSKTEAGTGRVIPLNETAIAALETHATWYMRRFGECRPEWYVFAFGTPLPKEPTRPITSFKTAWTKIRKKAGVKGRWHDNRHTLVTELAESGAGDDGDHEHRRARLSRHALALLPCADGSETARPR